MNFRVRSVIALTFILLASLAYMKQCNKVSEGREVMNFNGDWHFTLLDGDFSLADVDVSQWRSLDLPHDWSIEGDFSPDHPATVGGGALPGGAGWYRKQFLLPEKDSLKKIIIYFDAVYWNSSVYVNGKLVGKRPNGYISFYYDLTPYLYFGANENSIAIRVDNSQQPNSRWYSGSGIYRNVRLIKTSPQHFKLNRTCITTPKIEDKIALVHVEGELDIEQNDEEELRLDYSILSPSGKELIRGQLENPGSTFAIDMELEEPKRWSIDNPNLYILELSLSAKAAVLDREQTVFGIREFHFDPGEGFFLNGEKTKILGVCNHHDLGALGSAVNRRAIERQLELLKAMGCNAIRTAHNPPAPELLELCDEMGFLVMDETFDMWKKGKSPHDYSHYWDEWYKKDLEDHIYRDRNHPSVIMWSIGNEIIEQWDSTGVELTKELAGIVKQLDPTRPIVTGNNHPYPDNRLLQAGVMDVIGFNYHHQDFESFPEDFPGKCFIATETTSGLMTRGQYDMPSDSIRRWPVRWDIPFHGGNEDQSISSYDNVSTPWGSTHEESWRIIKKHDFLSGMFIWTGFDYLGEPTPYNWPSRSSYFGIIDLAGFPKDVYHMYRSEWTDQDVLHLLPHWNWDEGDNVTVFAYTNCDSVELFLNGRSLGTRINSDSIFHLAWDVNYEAGKLVARGSLASGGIIEDSVITATEPYALKMSIDREEIEAGGDDLAFVTVQVVDKAGNMVPDASNLIKCTVEGEGSVYRSDNGNQTSHESFLSPERKAFNGKCLFILKGGKSGGEMMVTVQSEGLEASSQKVKVKNK